MRESFGVRAARSSRPQGTIVPRKKFGPVCKVIWPEKTAAELAFRAGVSERAAKYWLAGDRKPSARALIEVMREIE